MRWSRETLLTVVLVVAALVLGSVITSRLPKPEDVMDAPFLHSAAPGETVRLRTASYTLRGVDAAREFKRGLDQGVTSGLWLVVSLDVTAHGEPMTVPSADARVVAADGRQFDRGVSGTYCGPLQPGLTMTCSLVFEVAPDALAGARLRIPASFVLEGPDDVADLDLGITPDQQAAWASAGRRITVPEPTPGAR